MTARSWLLRRTLRALGVPDDAARLLAAHGRLDDPPTTGLPRELDPGGACAGRRAAVPGRSTPRRDGCGPTGWNGRDPASPASCPGPLPLAQRHPPQLDGRQPGLGPDRPGRPPGLVTPPGGGWSLDWWIGADDRWHLPSRRWRCASGWSEALAGGGDHHEHPVGRRRGPGVSASGSARPRAAARWSSRSRTAPGCRWRLALAVRPCTPEGLTSSSGSTWPAGPCRSTAGRRWCWRGRRPGWRARPCAAATRPRS